MGKINETRKVVWSETTPPFKFTFFNTDETIFDLTDWDVWFTAHLIGNEIVTIKKKCTKDVGTGTATITLSKSDTYREGKYLVQVSIKDDVAEEELVVKEFRLDIKQKIGG